MTEKDLHKLIDDINTAIHINEHDYYENRYGFVTTRNGGIYYPYTWFKFEIDKHVINKIKNIIDDRNINIKDELNEILNTFTSINLPVRIMKNYLKDIGDIINNSIK